MNEWLLGICFLREAPERAIGTDRRARKWGLVEPIEIDVLTMEVIGVLSAIVISPSNSVSVEAIFPDNKTRVGSE